MKLSEMTPVDIVSIQKKAKWIARKMKFPELAEDFSQEIFIIMHRNEIGGYTQSLEHSFIDYIRKERGDIRRKKGLARSQNYSPVDNEGIDIPVESSDSNVSDNDYEHNFYYSLSLREHAICSMLNHGYSQKDIAFIYNLHDSRICQILKRIKNKAEINNFINTNKEIASLDIEWIKI